MKKSTVSLKETLVIDSINQFGDACCGCNWMC